MYHYVEDKIFLKRAQNCCSELMRELEDELRKREINSQFFLVGSGARNMVTQNGREAIDFDYNLNIIGCEDFHDCKNIKHEVIMAFNRVMSKNNLDNVDDSTSSITTKKIHFRDTPKIEFSMDVCIVTLENDKQWLRLIHEKGRNSYYDRYYWNIAPNSKNYAKKADAIKSVPGWWLKVREQYLKIKNNYLSQNDHNHPSFVCYVEAVHNVYNQMKSKKLL
jgi:hypothetical protein